MDENVFQINFQIIIIRNVHFSIAKLILKIPRYLMPIREAWCS